VYAIVICQAFTETQGKQADLLGGFQICHEVELCRLFYRQVNGLGSLEKIKAFDRTV
jgi:hypothetical protein